jgi:membrane-associated phospholipid phosphatase
MPWRAGRAISCVTARVLANLFPRDAVPLAALAREAGDARIWGGMHYPTDVVAGQELGAAVAARVSERARLDEAGVPR